MRRPSVIAILLAGILAVTLLDPPTASAVSEYRQGVPGRPFALSGSTGIRVDDTTADPALVPSTAILWEYSFHMLDPRSIQVLSNGNILYASRDGNCVKEVTRDKRVVWSFTNADYRSVFATTAAMLPFDADRTATGTTIITLRDGRPVFEVDRNKRLIWQYGNGTIGLEPGQLYDAYSASRLPNGNTLIADNHGARVIEVKTSDYDPDAPNMGYDESSIVWSLGKKGEDGEPLYAADHGYAEGYLDWPRTAQRIGANTLITDQTGQRVIEVQPSGHIVWQYGTTGVQSQAPNCLFDPSGALRAPDGTTFIVDGKDIGRVLRVGADGRLLSVYPDPDDTPPNGALYEPRAIALSKTGSLYIADEGHDRIIEVGRSTSAKATSREIDCGLPGVKKRFLGLDWDGDTGNRGSVTLFYSIDGGPWKTAGFAARNTLPDDAVGVTIRYRVSVTTVDHLDPPAVESVAVRYEPAGSKPSGAPTGTASPSRPATSTSAARSRTATVTPGLKLGSGSAGRGSYTGGGGDGVQAIGPLEHASGTVLQSVDIPTPGMPGRGTSGPVVPGVIAGVATFYFVGFALTPARMLAARVVAMFARRA